MSTFQDTDTDSVYVVADFQSADLPETVFQAELVAVNSRREKLQLPAVDITVSSTASMVGRELYGLSLSGGGIRSSTFNLGVLQALDRHGEFHRIDYLSTVSGGGYIGSCLTSYWAQDKKEEEESEAIQPVEEFPFRHRAGEPESKWFRHLREYSNYLKPPCPFAGLRLPGLFLRGLCVNALIVLPFLLFLAVVTVLFAKDVIRDALGTKQFEYVIYGETLEKERAGQRLANSDYQNIAINLQPYMEWTAYNKKIEVLLSQKSNKKLRCTEDMLKISNGCLLQEASWKNTLNVSEITKDSKVQFTIWESDSHFNRMVKQLKGVSFFKDLEFRWLYSVFKIIPNVFDAWQFNYPKELQVKNGESLENIAHRKYLLLSGVPKNSYSEKGNFLGGGQWLFEGQEARSLKLSIYIPPTNGDIHLTVRAWQTIDGGNQYKTESKNARIIYFPSEGIIQSEKLHEELPSLSKWKKEVEKKTTSINKKFFFWASNIPSHEKLKADQSRAELLSEDKSEWIFYNKGIDHLRSHLVKNEKSLRELTVDNPLKIVRWVSGGDKITDPITYLYHNTFDKTKWTLFVMVLILAFYPLLQTGVRIFGLKPWHLRDLMTRYICGGAVTVVLFVAFVELQPLVIYMFYRMKVAFTTTGIFGGADKAIAVLGCVIAACGGIFTARSMSFAAKAKAKIAIYALGVIGPVVLWLFYLNFCGWVVSCENVPEMFENVEGFVICVYIVVGIIIYLMSRRFYDVNQTSFHPFYRDRLSKAFLIKLDGETGDLLHNDEQKLQRVNSGYGPFHILNTTLNITGKTDADIKGRKADFFSFTREYVGSRVTGYAKTAEYEALDNHMGLGTAMAISAAAAAPNMGRETNRGITFILALFNIRLGYWAKNPRLLDSGLKKSFWGKLAQLWCCGKVGPTYLAKEMAGLVNEKSDYINLSDGGHLENMGLYELVRRRCKYIIVCDAEADKHMSCHGFADAIRMVLIDMGIKISIDLSDIYRKEKKVDGSFNVVGDSHHAVGTIQYGKGDKERGYLLYIKSSVSTQHAPYIKDYLAKNPNFPHESTADQFFNEAQFEAYRALGWEIGEKVMASLASLPEVTADEAEAIKLDKKRWKEQAELEWGTLVKRTKNKLL